MQSLTSAPAIKPWQKLEDFESPEVGSILVGHYEMRYEIQVSTIDVLRLSEISH